MSLVLISLVTFVPQRTNVYPQYVDRRAGHLPRFNPVVYELSVGGWGHDLDSISGANLVRLFNEGNELSQ